MKSSIPLAGALMVLAAPALLAQNITGSDHDFSGASWNSSGQICIVCHTPHFADNTVTEAPLWNHSVTSASYTTYSSTTLNATVGAPGGISLLCLSCHDGTVALDSFGGATGSQQIGSGANVGGGTLGGGSADISDDHPISFTYDTPLSTADGELADPASSNSGLGDTIENDLLFGSLMECATCHDVHDDTNNPFLRIDNSGSALCLTCHVK